MRKLSEKKTDVIYLRVAPKIKKKMQRAAKRADAHFSEWVIYCCEKEMEE